VVRLTLVALLTFAVGLGLSASGSATHGHSAYFVTPSHKIICAWNTGDAQSRPSLRCDVGFRLDPRPPRPKWCDLDWAYGLSMSSVGRASPICAGDSVFHGWKPVLAYGETWRKRGFTCRSRSVGLTCTNTRGHGFFLSRERWRLF
jgi:hypothetical protein